MKHWLVDRIRSVDVRKQSSLQVIVGGADECWNWTAATAKDGHAFIKVGGKKGRCGRSAVGEGNGRSKLKVADIPVHPASLHDQHAVASIARLSKVDNRVIRDIRDGRKWQCVPLLMISLSLSAEAA